MCEYNFMHNELESIAMIYFVISPDVPLGRCRIDILNRKLCPVVEV